jgi:hypothetical protein
MSWRVLPGLRAGASRDPVSWRLTVSSFSSSPTLRRPLLPFSDPHRESHGRA